MDPDTTIRHILRDARARGLPPDAHLLLVDATRQSLTHWHDGQIRAVYPVSTSRFGLGCREGSQQTPTGFHSIRDRIGRDAPLGQVFEHRLPIPLILPPSQWQQHGDADRILSRILRLDGLEPGINHGPDIDSFHRSIYLHGTNQEHLLGSPASHGCIRLGNQHIASLCHHLASHPAWCWIGPLHPT